MKRCRVQARIRALENPFFSLFLSFILCACCGRSYRKFSIHSYGMCCERLRFLDRFSLKIPEEEIGKLLQKFDNRLVKRGIESLCVDGYSTWHLESTANCRELC